MTIDSRNRAVKIPIQGKRKEVMAGNSRDKYNGNSAILRSEPVIIQNESTSRPAQVGGTWSIKFSLGPNRDLFPEKFWLSEKYLESTGLHRKQGILSLDDWLECIVDEDKTKMKKHMLSTLSDDPSPDTLIYSVRTDENSIKHFFSVASSIIDDANGSLHVRAVDWELNNAEFDVINYLFQSSGEINNQLLAIQGWTDLMSFNSRDVNDMNEYVHRITDCIQRAAERTHDMIFFIAERSSR